MFNYVVPVSLNDSRKRGSGGVRAPRKKPMNTLQLTFDNLTQTMLERCQLTGKASQSVSNLTSALRAFMDDHGFSGSSVVGSHLRNSYYRRVREHVDSLVKEGRSGRYIANRKSLLSKWHSLTIELDRQYALTVGAATPFQKALKELVSRSPNQRRVAKETGVPLSTLKRWLTGVTPQKKGLSALRRIESYFGTTPGYLVELATNSATHSPSTVGEHREITYRRRLAEAQGSRISLSVISEHLKREWSDFVDYKVDILPVLERPSNGRWRATEHHTKTESPQLWFAFHNSLFVPTASINWHAITNFLGWLSLENKHAGAGFPPEKVQTLGWLLSVRFLQAYVSWFVKRSDGLVHGGMINFVLLVKGMTHPVTGYLTQSPHLASALCSEANISDWKTACNSAFEWSKKALKHLAPQKKKSRDPYEPIRAVLEDEHPMRHVADMIARINSAQPATGGLAEALWMRDLVLIEILTSNPLRAKNLKLLTYKSDNSGQLYQTPSGEWRILIQPEYIKNENGAARNNPYDMPVSEIFWRDIERYLKRYRPLLPRSESLDYVFLSSDTEKPPAPWDNLNRRVFHLTKQHLWRCPGVGPHGFRYINGTAILKAQPGAWEVAAQVLHDKEETVRAHYAHLRGTDGAARAHAILNQAFKRSVETT